MAYAKLPLEWVFRTSKVRVLDHLITMKGLDFTPFDLARILKIDRMAIEKQLERFEDLELIEHTGNNKYRLADNPRTLALHKFMHETALYNIDRFGKQKVGTG